MAAAPAAWSAERIEVQPQALYTFDEGSGDVVHDRSGRSDPIDLKIDKSNAVSWQKGQVTINSGTSIASSKPPTRLIRAIQDSQELTVEAWIAPKNTNQSGPARIVTISSNTSLRNFTLGQDGHKYDARLRTTKTSSNGIPSISSQDRSLEPRMTHVVYTHNRSGATRIYIDGKVSSDHKVDGSLSNWDRNYRLALANELSGDRPWLGSLQLVAIYDRALSNDEVNQNYAAGVQATAGPSSFAGLGTSAGDQLFVTQVAPLLAKSCVECHDSATHKGGLDLSHMKSAFAGGESGKAVVAGKSHESLLWDRIESGEMPPEGEPLNSSEKTALKKWIDAGAAWPVDFIDPAVYAMNDSDQVWVQRLTIPEYIETVRSVTGVDITQEAHELLPPDLRADGFRNTAYNLNVDLQHVEAYAKLARIIVDRMDIGEFAKRFSSAKSLNTDATARKFVSALGEWVLRGPIEDREVTNYSGIMTSVASSGGSYEEGVGLLIEAMLQSPRFIYRIEWQRGSGTERSANDYELASRLSYIIWGAPPDKELLEVAKKGKLGGQQEYENQIRRMLQDPRARERSKQFVIEWLNLDRLENLRPNTDRFPKWNPELAKDMRDETIAYFEEVVWNQNRPLNELFNAQYTFVTPRLAEHYGLKPQGNGQRRYDLANVPSRGGLLTQGSVLTIGGDDASMVTRGLFVLRDVLRGVIGAPPPGVDTTPVPATPGTSLRKIAEHRVANESCGGCHKKFEPLAYGLERYDGLGSFRMKDEYGNALRSDGQVLIPGTGQPQKYDESAQLMDLLANSDRVRETLTWKVTQFALGRPLAAEDAPEMQRVYQQAQAAGGTYSNIIAFLCTSDLVRKVRTEK
ncbi:DUF1592 domain-containing protein [bacterium]|nr:DUF1592 domain-containing protein [bacterium]